MKKDLPSIFANKIDKDVFNNRSCSISKNEEKREIKSNFDIKDKINLIFNSPRYVYKANVEIKTKEKTMVKKIIGKKDNNLITFENELIPFESILDINYIE